MIRAAMSLMQEKGNCLMQKNNDCLAQKNVVWRKK